MDSYRSNGYGLLTFATVMIGIAGVFNIIDGIVALADSSFYVAGATFVDGSLKTWGWIILVLGILQLMASIALVGGSQLARWFGVVVTALNALGQLAFIPAYPFWAICLFAIDIVIIYGLTVYGGQALDT